MKYIGIVSLLLLWGCSTVQQEADPNKKATKQTNKDGKISYLALGDSYTIGESVAPENRYPNLLADALQEKGLDVEKPLIIAQTGWTTTDLKKGIQKANIEGRTYDMVTLLIGVNNQYQGLSLEAYEKEYEALLEQAIHFAAGNKDHVFVISIPDYGRTPFGADKRDQIAKEINAFNAACRTITENHGVQFFNITPISRKADENSELVAKDNLHPSGKMYQQWVDFIADKVYSKIKNVKD